MSDSSRTGRVLETRRDLSNEKRSCPACNASDTEFLYEINEIPTQSAIVLDNASAAAAYPTGDLKLRWCGACGIAFNSEFDESRVHYGDGYEESQSASPTFRRYAREIAQRWNEQYELLGSRAVEVGCGKGEFLELLCSITKGSGVGFDPVWDPSRADEETAPNLKFFGRNFTESDTPIDAHIIISRHTLEHVKDVQRFVSMLRSACDSSIIKLVAVEVPDLQRILQESAFWDIYYEHATYFTARALVGLFEREGFEVLSTHRVYGDQYLVLEARPSTGPQRSLEASGKFTQDVQLVQDFSEGVQAAMKRWQSLFDEWDRVDKKVALWGSGSKAVGFLTSIGASDLVDAVIDINPFRNGRYMPGVPVPIVSPESLVSSPPDCIVIMNPIYEKEIGETLSALGLFPDLYTADSIPERTT